MKRKAKKRGTPRPRLIEPPAESDLPEAADTPHPPSSIVAGGDVDTDLARAESSGEEAVGGTVATPDQDVVDEIGRALGVEQASDAEVRPSEDLLHDRDRRRWQLERDARDDRP
jgi:Family of unknown function (DUF6335)